MRYLNLNDFYDQQLHGPDWRTAWLNCLNTAMTQNYTRIYVPWGTRTAKISAADKVTQFSPARRSQIPGDGNIASLLYIDRDIEIYGDGEKFSICEFGSDDAALKFSAFRLFNQCNVVFRDIALVGTRMEQAINGPTSTGVYYPTMHSMDPATQDKTPLGTASFQRASVLGFYYGIEVPSGPVRSLGRVLIELEKGEVAGQRVGISMFNDPLGVNNRAIHVNGTKFRTFNLASGLGSHLIYHHPQTNIRMRDPHFSDWLAAKYAVQSYGGGNDTPPRYVEYDNPHFDRSGNGYAMITTQNGLTQIRGGLLECRAPILMRGPTQIDGMRVQALPGNTGAFAGFEPEARFQISNIIADCSGAGPYTLFGLGTARCYWQVQNVHAFSNARNQGLTIIGASPLNPGSSASVFRGRDIFIDGYRSTPAEWADAGLRSSMTLISAYHGDIQIEGGYCKGSFTHDRGAVRLEHSVAQPPTASDLKRLDLRSFQIETGGHGATMYVDELIDTGASAGTRVGYSGKVTGDFLHDGKIILKDGSWEALSLPIGVADVAAAASLVLPTQANLFRVNAPSSTVVVITQINIGGSGTLSQNSAYVGARVSLRCDGVWEIGAGGNVRGAPGPRQAGRVADFIVASDGALEEATA